MVGMKTDGTTRDGSTDSQTVTQCGDKGLVRSVVDLACSHVLSVRRLHSVESARQAMRGCPGRYCGRGTYSFCLKGCTVCDRKGNADSMVFSQRTNSSVRIPTTTAHNQRRLSSHSTRLDGMMIVDVSVIPVIVTLGEGDSG